MVATSTYESMVCTKGIAAKFVKWTVAEISSVRLLEGMILISNYNGETIPIPKNQFNSEFAKNRKARSEGLIVIQKEEHSCLFEVSSGSGNGYYEVTLTRFGAHCNCTDYRNQLDAFNGDGCCKHGYGTLTKIGFKNLKEYREAWNKPGATLEKIIKQRAAVAV